MWHLYNLIHEVRMEKQLTRPRKFIVSSPGGSRTRNSRETCTERIFYRFNRVAPCTVEFDSRSYTRGVDACNIRRGIFYSSDIRNR